MLPDLMTRRALVVRGVVQGVGFRPFIFALASRLKLGGFVRNDAGTVVIEIEGANAAVDELARALVESAPPLARIASVEWRELAPRDEREFSIVDSTTPA